MSVSPHPTIGSESTSSGTATCALADLEALGAEAGPAALVGERLLAAQAAWLLFHLDKDLMEARAQFNQDWFRRVMRIRSKAASRLRRRWGKIYPPPAIPLGNLRRRYHVHLARYLYNLPSPQEEPCSNVRTTKRN